MISLGSLGDRFQSTLVSEIGLPFRGVIQPIEDSKIYNDDFYYTRQILRIHPNVPIVPGDTIIAPGGHRFLLGALDEAHSQDIAIYTSFQMYPCNKLIPWTRDGTTIDPLTKLAKSTGPQTLGPIWVLIENLVREVRSSEIRVAEETKRVITGANVELGDTLDGMVVRKLNISRGVRILEVV